MTDDMTKRRDELASEWGDGADQAFIKGWNDCQIEMQAQQASIINDLKDMGNNKFDEIQRLTKERDSLKAQLDLAVNALSCYSEYCATTNRYPEIAKTAIEQIQKMRGGG